MHFFQVRTRTGAYVGLAFITLAWGINWVMVKVGVESAPPLVFNAERTWLAAVALFAFQIAGRRLEWPSSWQAVIVTGLFQTAINFGASTMAVAYGGAGRAAALAFTMPFWTLLFAWIVLGERVRGAQWIAIAFAAVGLTFLIEPWNWQGSLVPKLWAVLSGCGWGAGAVTSKYYLKTTKMDVSTLITWQMLAGAIMLTPLAFLQSSAPVPWSTNHVVALFYVGVISTALGVLIWTEVLHFLPAGVASLNLFATLLIAIVSSRLVFGERFTASEWTGIACLVAGLAIVTGLTAYAARRGERTPPDATAPEGG
jgi:drug/metabolite transporter (DMT)-like permease